MAIPNSVSAEINDEKVIVKFKIPETYSGRQLVINLCTPDPNIRVTTLKVTVVSATERMVEWNYQQDIVPRAMASQPNKLRIYAYDITNMPKAKLSPGTKKGTLILGGVGAGVGLLGLWPWLDAKAKHKNYLKYEGLDDPFYADKGTDRDRYYKKVDNEYVLGQTMMYAGGAAVVVAIIWAVREKKEAKKELKNTICMNPPRWNLEPVVVMGNTPGIGFSWKF